MRGLILIAAAAALLGACDSNGCGGSSSNSPSSGESTGMSGGGGGHGGGLGEPVSFQGIGKKQDPPPAQAGPAQASAAAAPGSPGANAAAAAAGAAATASQSVICGGFPNLPPDCTQAPEFDAIKKKCCPTGQVAVCQGIPGGARLTGVGCTAAAK